MSAPSQNPSSGFDPLQSLQQAVDTLRSPEKLSALMDSIANGIRMNTDAMNKLQQQLTHYRNKDIKDQRKITDLANSTLGSYDSLEQRSYFRKLNTTIFALLKCSRVTQEFEMDDTLPLNNVLNIIKQNSHNGLKTNTNLIGRLYVNTQKDPLLRRNSQGKKLGSLKRNTHVYLDPTALPKVFKNKRNDNENLFVGIQDKDGNSLGYCCAKFLQTNTNPSVYTASSEQVYQTKQNLNNIPLIQNEIKGTKTVIDTQLSQMQDKKEEAAFKIIITKFTDLIDRSTNKVKTGLHLPEKINEDSIKAINSKHTKLIQVNKKLKALHTALKNYGKPSTPPATPAPPTPTAPPTPPAPPAPSTPSTPPATPAPPTPTAPQNPTTPQPRSRSANPRNPESQETQQKNIPQVPTFNESTFKGSKAYAVKHLQAAVNYLQRNFPDRKYDNPPKSLDETIGRLIKNFKKPEASQQKDINKLNFILNQLGTIEFNFESHGRNDKRSAKEKAAEKYLKKLTSAISKAHKKMQSTIEASSAESVPYNLETFNYTNGVGLERINQFEQSLKALRTQVNSGNSNLQLFNGLKLLPSTQVLLKSTPKLTIVKDIVCYNSQNISPHNTIKLSNLKQPSKELQLQKELRKISTVAAAKNETNQDAVDNGLYYIQNLSTIKEELGGICTNQEIEAIFNFNNLQDHHSNQNLPKTLEDIKTTLSLYPKDSQTRSLDRISRREFINNASFQTLRQKHIELRDKTLNVYGTKLEKHKNLFKRKNYDFTGSFINNNQNFNINIEEALTSPNLTKRQATAKQFTDFTTKFTEQIEQYSKPLVQLHYKNTFSPAKAETYTTLANEIQTKSTLGTNQQTLFQKLIEHYCQNPNRDAQLITSQIQNIETNRLFTNLTQDLKASFYIRSGKFDKAKNCNPSSTKTQALLRLQEKISTRDAMFRKGVELKASYLYQFIETKDLSTSEIAELPNYMAALNIDNPKRVSQFSAIAKLGRSPKTKEFLTLYDKNQRKEFRIKNNTFQIYLCDKESGASTHYEQLDINQLEIEDSNEITYKGKTYIRQTVGSRHWKEQ